MKPEFLLMVPFKLPLDSLLLVFVLKCVNMTASVLPNCDFLGMQEMRLPQLLHAALFSPLNYPIFVALLGFF